MLFQDPEKHIRYYIEHRNERDKQIYETLKQYPEKPLNAMDLVKLIYVAVPDYLKPAAAYNVSHHLKKLTKENKIKCSIIDGENKWHYVTPMPSNL